MPQELIVLKHAWAERGHSIRRFYFYVEQGDPRTGLGLLCRDRLLYWNLDHKVQDATIALRRVRKHFLVEPLDLGEIESIRPVGKEELEELRKELVEQGLEALIVVLHEPALQGLQWR
jgi:hypothetical protein